MIRKASLNINELFSEGVYPTVYAMENAVPELKSIAMGVIDSNNEDGVAHWLEKNIF